MFETVLAFVKQNVKVVVTVAALGIAVTVGWAKGCVYSVGPDTVPVAAPAAAAPAVDAGTP